MKPNSRTLAEPKAALPSSLSPTYLGITDSQQKVLEALGAFGTLRLRELALAVTDVDTESRAENISQLTIDALAGEYPDEATSVGADPTQKRVKSQYAKLRKPLSTPEDSVLVDITTGAPSGFAEISVPRGHWRSARIAAIDVEDSAMIKRAEYHTKICISRGFVRTEKVPRFGAYYFLTKKGAAALNFYTPLATQQHQWVASTVEKISAPVHTATATHYLLYRKNQGRPIWSEYALHGKRTSPTVGQHILTVSGTHFAHQFGRRPDGLVRLPDGTLEVVEAENAEKPLETFIAAMNVLSAYPTTVLHGEQISRLTFVVPSDRFDKLIYKAATLFFDGTHPALGLPRFEGKTSMKGSPEEKLMEFYSRINIHEVSLTEHRGSPYNVARETSLADVVESLRLADS